MSILHRFDNIVAVGSYNNPSNARFQDDLNASRSSPGVPPLTYEIENRLEASNPVDVLTDVFDIKSDNYKVTKIEIGIDGTATQSDGLFKAVLLVEYDGIEGGAYLFDLPYLVHDNIFYADISNDDAIPILSSFKWNDLRKIKLKVFGKNDSVFNKNFFIDCTFLRVDFIFNRAKIDFDYDCTKDIPEFYLETEDTRKFLEIFQHAFFLFYEQKYWFLDSIDYDKAEERYVNMMFLETGWPVEFDLDLLLKRKIIKYANYIYSVKGISEGIVLAVKQITGIDIVIDDTEKVGTFILNDMSLGEFSELGYSSNLYIRVLTPVLTADELEIIDKLVSFMKWAPVVHEIFQVL
jgi:phage tail-like protein